MAEPATDVLVAGYRDIDEATRDFEAPVALVKAKRVSIDGVILVTHARDGSVSQPTGGRRLLGSVQVPVEVWTIGFANERRM
jgi:hypothetical protein